MPGKFNYEKLRKYPHLLGEDIPIWSRFIDRHPDKFQTADYDIHVGTGSDPEPYEEEKYSRQWNNLTKKRIDVIGWNNQQPTIIEVKKRVTLSTLGQVLGYRILFKKERPDIPSPALLIICESIGPDDKFCLNEFHIPFEIV